MIKKIWNDPVWSKIIASSILGVITLIGIFIKSNYDEKSFYETLIWLVKYPIQLFYILLLFLIGFSVQKIFKLKKNFYSSKQRKLRGFNFTIDIEAGIKSEWTVSFNSNGKPFITDLEIYCMEHGDVPLRFFGNKCSTVGCKNSRLHFNEFEIINHLESYVLNEWNKLNNNTL